MFTSSLTLSTLALTLMQGFAAAAPGYPIGNSTVHYHPSGTGASHPPLSQTVYPTINPVANTTTTVAPPPYYTATTITSTLTHTKTLTWTINVPCTTTVHGSTSYYSTASVYTTCIPEYETVTVTKTCDKGCNTPEPTPTTIYFTPGHISSIPSSVIPKPTISSIPESPKPTSIAPPAHTVNTIIIENTPTPKPTTTISTSNPIYTLPPVYTCPPAVTVTVPAVKTVTITEAYKTVTVTDAAKTVTVTANPTASSAHPHGDCKPGMSCYTYTRTYTSNGSWNSTMTKPTHHGTGTVTILPTGTGAYHH